MGWNEYYQNKCISFEEQAQGYKKLVTACANQNPSLLDQRKPKVFVLGGFFPTNGTPEQFRDFCQQIHPNPNDRHILLDMNRYPLETVDDSTPKLQANIAALPFKRNSLDVIVLDFTTHFMRDEEVELLALDAKRTLKPNGLVLSAIPSRKPLDLLDFFDDRPRGWVPTYFRTPSDFMHLAYSLSGSRLTPAAIIKEEQAYLCAFKP